MPTLRSYWNTTVAPDAQTADVSQTFAQQITVKNIKHLRRDGITGVDILNHGIYAGREGNWLPGVPASPLANTYHVGQNGPDGKKMQNGDAAKWFGQDLRAILDGKKPKRALPNTAIVELERLTEKLLNKEHFALTCWCVPLPCHCNEIKSVVVELAEKIIRTKNAERLTTRLYRVQDTTVGSGPSDWNANTPEYAATVAATGRWFTPSIEEAAWYEQHVLNDNGTPIWTYVDVTPEEFQASKVANHPNAAKFSRRPDIEHFVARDVAERAQRLPPNDLAACRAQLAAQSTTIPASPPVWLIIAGGREDKHHPGHIYGVPNAIIDQAIDTILSQSGLNVATVVSGTATGADRAGERWAKRHKVAIDKNKPQWDKPDPNHPGKTIPDKTAGMRRNTDMANKADALLALWDGESKGTQNMINTAIRMGLHVIVSRVDRNFEITTTPAKRKPLDRTPPTDRSSTNQNQRSIIIEKNARSPYQMYHGDLAALKIIDFQPYQVSLEQQLEQKNEAVRKALNLLAAETKKGKLIIGCADTAAAEDAEVVANLICTKVQNVTIQNTMIPHKHQQLR